MQYYKDLYGATADQRTFVEAEEALIDPLAERLIELLHVDLERYYSESQGGFCYSKAFIKGDSFENLHVYINPNHIIESDGDYWLEEEFQQFALLLSVGSATKSLIDRARSAIKAAPDLNLTLIRSTYSPDLDGDQPNIIEFELGAEEARS